MAIGASAAVSLGSGRGAGGVSSFGGIGRAANLRSSFNSVEGGGRGGQATFSSRGLARFNNPEARRSQFRVIDNPKFNRQDKASASSESFKQKLIYNNKNVQVRINPVIGEFRSKTPANDNASIRVNDFLEFKPRIAVNDNEPMKKAQVEKKGLQNKRGADNTPKVVVNFQELKEKKAAASNILIAGQDLKAHISSPLTFPERNGDIRKSVTLRGGEINRPMSFKGEDLRKTFPINSVEVRKSSLFYEGKRSLPVLSINDAWRPTFSEVITDNNERFRLSGNVKAEFGLSAVQRVQLPMLRKPQIDRRITEIQEELRKLAIPKRELDAKKLIENDLKQEMRAVSYKEDLPMQELREQMNPVLNNQVFRDGIKTSQSVEEWIESIKQELRSLNVSSNPALRQNLEAQLHTQDQTAKVKQLRESMKHQLEKAIKQNSKIKNSPSFEKSGKPELKQKKKELFLVVDPVVKGVRDRLARLAIDMFAKKNGKQTEEGGLFRAASLPRPREAMSPIAKNRDGSLDGFIETLSMSKTPDQAKSIIPIANDANNPVKRSEVNGQQATEEEVRKVVSGDYGTSIN